ncbi:MFS general substrate transporter [Didymella exigua CBS 183.55]|uniref:MFS general substrate transporter n=1 Tax=Didymella exigua CBS 183.55 TaxID=1150837 RepID=A0A6A5RGZ9_9PLEO|nr:MFS general substrate transporter [Didymella exigua CBS 183.55]KAF1927595.1 MFS general substrate transporter [Didymella exigua CBS 183.55]
MAEPADDKSARLSTISQPVRTSLDSVSPGVARIEATAEHLTTANRACILFGVLLAAWAYGLDSILRTAYQPLAVNALKANAQLATVTVCRAVIGAAAQVTNTVKPTAAKIADVFGRMEVLVASVILYVLGSAIEASANNPATLTTGSVFYQIGYTMAVLILEVIVADTTSLRSRLFFSYVPAIPFLVNTWVGAEVLDDIRALGSWRYGFWIWCIIYPICNLPLFGSLWWVNRKAKKAGTLQQYKTPVQEHGAWAVAKALFWQLDVVGLVLTVCVFGFLLVPLTINEGNGQTWGQAKFIAPLVTGVLCIPVWIRWERIAPHPMVPFYLLKDRAVWGALAIGFFLMFSWACQADFLFLVMRVAFNQGEKATTRIVALYSFCSTLAGIAVGTVVYRVRRLKPFILFGTFLFLVALGLMIYYRGGVGTQSGIIGSQVLLGIAGGFFPYAAQASIQAATDHEHVAVVTGLYLSMYNIGSAVGNAISGVVFSQVVPGQLRIRGLSNEAADKWYREPLDHVNAFPPGTAERDTVIEAYKYFQRIVCIIAACGCLGLIAFAFCIRNPRLPDTQSLPYDELPQKDQDVEQRESHLMETYPSCTSVNRR